MNDDTDNEQLRIVTVIYCTETDYDCMRRAQENFLLSF